MSRSDGVSTRLGCVTPGCSGRFQVDDRGPETILRCRVCRAEWPRSRWSELAAIAQRPRPCVDCCQPLNPRELRRGLTRHVDCTPNVFDQLGDTE